MADADVKIQLVATTEAVRAQLQEMTRAFQDMAKSAGTSLSGVRGPAGQATEGLDKLSAGLRNWRREAVQEQRFAGFFVQQIEKVGLVGKETGGVLGELAAGFAFGGAAGVGIEVLKLVVGALTATRREAKAAEEALKKAGAEAAKAWRDYAESLRGASEARRIFLRVAGTQAEELSINEKNQRQLREEIALLEQKTFLLQSLQQGAEERIRAGLPVSSAQQEALDAAARRGGAGRDLERLIRARAELEELEKKGSKLREFVNQQEALRAEAEKAASGATERVDKIIGKNLEDERKMRLEHEVAIRGLIAEGLENRAKIVADGEAKIAAIRKKYAGTLGMARERDEEIAQEKKNTDRRVFEYEQAIRLKALEKEIEEGGMEGNKPALDKMKADDAAERVRKLKEAMDEAKDAGKHMGDAIGTAFAAAATGAQSWGKALRQILAEAIKMVAQYAIKHIMASAGTAGAGAAESQASIPYIGPALAAAAAAAMMALVLGFTSMVASAAGGWELPSSGVSYPAVLHPGEMVLPADLSRGVKEMVRGEGAGTQRGRAVQITIHAVDARSVERLFRDNEGALIRTLDRIARNGRAG